MRNIILVAPPAAGKGTQAIILCEKYVLTHISTGDLIREAITKDDIISDFLKKVIEIGSLVSDELIFKLIKEKLINTSNGYVLDGFPRNLEQAKQYDILLESLNQNITCVIYLSIDENLAMNRVLNRLSCSNCDHVYNLLENEPKINNICDFCGSKLIKRQDDNEETFKVRFKTYLEQTQPIIDFYKNKKILYEVNSNRSKEEISSDIERIVDSL